MAAVASIPMEAACDGGRATRKERDLPAYVLTLELAFPGVGRTPTPGEETSSDDFARDGD